jgi:hypothetical protein
MSLAIDVDEVTAVLLPDGWHDVLDRSFSLDSYEYIWWQDMKPEQRERENPMVMLGGGQVQGVPSTGFTFKAKDGWLAGPLTAVLAVKRPAKS